ncbi:hypothetical protein MBAV_005432 [Candidatus Magnetobacterium bavaricum]|uniref:Uncharacterized protein n=1 Tax=Candidatus Magnetobacterium bavaricum TaxID=29290 RepID=A0A0F3GKD0_9BACT|nr:hypothetical protein MBAV_005432 [Candidatus Magnetobacterium bavaricum]
MTWRVDEAIAAFTRAVDLSPQSASMHKNLAYALKKAGRLNEAQAHMVQSQRLGSEH